MKQINKVALFVFLASFIFRIIIINYTKSSNDLADISCLVNGGQMISNGINPYNFNDNIKLRNQLRLDSIANNSWLCSSQDLWNYHSANNLPFNLLFNGLVDYVFKSDVNYYRYTYAFFDSAIGYIAVLILFALVGLPLTKMNIIYTFLISSLSPLLVLNGTLIPEDKGMQVFFMLLAFWFSYNKKLIFACLFLSFSFGFKAVGVFIAPICLIYYVLTRDTFFETNKWWVVARELFYKRKNLLQSLYFTGLTLLLFGIFYIPYASDFSNIINQRVLYDIDNAPNHSSLWIIFYNLFPESWDTIRFTVSITLFCLLIAGFLTNLIPIDIFALSILVMFLCVIFLTGSLDRNNMAMQPAILIMALRWRQASRYLGFYYGFGGMLLLLPVMYRHFIDSSLEYAFYSSLFVLGFCILFFFLVFRNAFKIFMSQRNTDHENKLADSATNYL